MFKVSFKNRGRMQKPLDEEEGRVRLHHADCIDIFKTITDNSIDLIVTDPP